ncbi:MAG: polysaccharide deacetylase family protein [Planctomycetota bacterium]
MNPLAALALTAYRYATRGLRETWMEHLGRQGRAPVCGLFYHRVADDHPNGWTIGRDAFRRQLDWLSERFEVVSLVEARRRLVTEDSRRPSVVITFDDGYADNMDFALPLLVERGLPATYFVTTENIAQQRPFPHDIAAGVPLKPNTVADLRRIADSGVEVAAHTLTHPDLGAVDDERLEREIRDSFRQVAEWIGKPVRSFAFPFGLPTNMSSLGMQIARDAGAQMICSAYGGYNFPGEVVDHGGAIHFRRCHADPDWPRFLNKMTFDPRSLDRGEPIDDAAWLDVVVPTAANPTVEAVL